MTSSPARAQDGVDVTFEAETITVEQKNTVMVAKGKYQGHPTKVKYWRHKVSSSTVLPVCKGNGRSKAQNERWRRISSR